MFGKKRITPEQEKILNSFTCERLTASQANKDAIKKFECRRNFGLARKLKEEAWNEDTDGLPAVYYVVKDAQGTIALYFSLQCGTLCDVAYVDQVLENYDRVRELMDRLQYDRQEFWPDDELYHLRNDGTISYAEKINRISEYFKAKNELMPIKDDKRREPNEKMIRVSESFPAVELVHFVANDKYKNQWAALNLGHSMGEVFFWKFVLPKIEEINKLVGCEYVYLFAAEGSYANKLVKYYRDVLHFELTEKISGIKPRYDYECIFMYKRLHRLSQHRTNYVNKDLYGAQDALSLADYRKSFFENFNA